MVAPLAEIDLIHVRRIADQASTCSGRLGLAGERLLAVVTVLRVADDLPPETPGLAGVLENAAATLAEVWRGLFDAANVPRRELPRLPSPTRH